MKQLDKISGFTELKDMLIRTYLINRSHDLVKLFFSERKNALYVHDYDDHSKALRICNNIELEYIPHGLPPNVFRLANESLKHASPAEFLINEFKLSGFFIG